MQQPTGGGDESGRAKGGSQHTITEADIEEEQEKIASYEAAFREIKEATGVADVNEVIQKFLSQEETHQNLLQMTRDSQGSIDAHREALEQERAQVSRLQYELVSSGEEQQKRRQESGATGGGDGVAKARQELDRGRARWKRIWRTQVNCKAAVQHILELLEPLRLEDESSTPLTDESMLPLLQQAEKKLMRVAAAFLEEEQRHASPEAKEAKRTAPAIDLDPGIAVVRFDDAERSQRLEGFDQALLGLNDVSAYEKAHIVRSSIIYTGVPIQHCRDLISAFKQDAVKLRYDNWDDLMDYCDRSAAPVGRYLLDLHGVSRDLYPASDALCNALQVINHLQDCQSDFREMNRVYLPQDWMIQAGVDVSDLDHSFTGRGLRRVLNHCLNETSELLGLARQLPGPMSSRRLAMESAAIIRIAERLVFELRRRDPLAERVVLTKSQYFVYCLFGIMRLFFKIR